MSELELNQGLCNECYQEQITPFTSSQKRKESEQEPNPQNIITQQAQQIIQLQKENEHLNQLLYSLQQNQFWMQYFAQPASIEETELQQEELNRQEVYTIGQLELEEEYLLTLEDQVET
ncbi:11170_t:CDS:2, partial [Ambispora leptoticha]